MKVEKAKEMGFCFGVRRAIDIVERAARQDGPLDSLGAIVHNRRVVERLAACGVRVVESLDEVKGGVVAITSHGVGPEVFQEIRSRRLGVVDATCPFVRRAQAAAQKLAKAGFSVVIFGDADHPEVRGLLGWAGEKGCAMEQFAPWWSKLPRRLGILSQTTQSPASFAQFVGELIDTTLVEVDELRIVNTICTATRRRYAAARRLASRVDLMLVVGGRDSANTRRLAEICRSSGVETHHIEAAGEIDPSWLGGRRRIGVTAGASTPDQAVDEVVFRLEERDQEGTWEA